MWYSSEDERPRYIGNMVGEVREDQRIFIESVEIIEPINITLEDILIFHSPEGVQKNLGVGFHHPSLPGEGYQELVEDSWPDFDGINSEGYPAGAITLAAGVRAVDPTDCSRASGVRVNYRTHKKSYTVTWNSHYIIQNNKGSDCGYLDTADEWKREK